MGDSPRDKSGRRRKVELAAAADDHAAHTFVVAFGEGMRRLRRAREWTQVELADRAT